VVRPDTPSPDARLRMRANRRRDTKPELALRRELHARGRRFRVDYPPIKGLRRRADIVFPRALVAVYVDGCYWHSCPLHGTTAKTNAAFWAQKLATNQERDRDTDRRLTEAGWTVVRVWEHERAEEAADRVEASLGASGADRLDPARR
jgi:DNA mismatch endonuclease (patch repair protein)